MANTQVFGTCNSCSNQDTSTKYFKFLLVFSKKFCILV